MYCNEEISKEMFMNLVSVFAVKDSIRILPFMFTPRNEFKVVCPCCVLDRRLDNSQLLSLKRKDPWVSMFVKEKAKIHSLEIAKSSKSYAVEPGFSVRPVNESSWRSKYGKIDTPIFRDLGFRGYKFDRNIFFPIAVYKSNKNMVRVGIPNPDLLDAYPALQHAASSWIFRVREVPPYEIPDILPISNVGSFHISEPITCRNIYSFDKNVQIGNFYPVLFERANRKTFTSGQAGLRK